MNFQESGLPPLGENAGPREITAHIRALERLLTIAFRSIGEENLTEDLRNKINRTEAQ